MAIYLPNKKEDGYCYLCRHDVDSEELIQCDKCKNWFCKTHIKVVNDICEPGKNMINLCDQCQGKTVLF